MHTTLILLSTGSGQQTEDASWWPKIGQWGRSGMYTGFWTPWNEQWFNTHRKAITEGKQGTHNSQEWKKQLQQFDDANKVGRYLLKASENFVDNFIVPL